MLSIPEVTVIMPVKNVALFIEESIGSILNQSFSDFRFIIIDDHSIDDTYSIVNQLAFDDPRIDLHRGTKQGFVNCLNQGIGLNESALIARMDGDDVSHLSRFEKQVEFLRHNQQVDICGSWIRLFGDKQEVWHYREHDEHIKNLMMFKRSGFGHNAVMLRKSVYDEFLYEPEFEYCEDYRLWTKIAANSDFKFHNLQEVLVDYRIHSTQVISTKQSIQKKLRNDILRDFLIDLGMNFSEEEFLLYQKLRELQTNFDKREANILGRFMFRLKSVTQEKFPDSYGVYDGYLNVLKDSLGTVTC